MLAGLCALVGAPAATGGEGRWRRPGGVAKAVSAFDAGLDTRGRALFMAYHREVGPDADPIFRGLARVPGRLVVHSRKDVVPDTVWYRSKAWQDYRRPIGIDNQLTSVFQVSEAGAVSVIALLRAQGEREFAPRARALVRFFHGELGPLIGRALVSALEPSPRRLPPRLGQTLACLLEGDSEKQVAARLTLSHATTHQYVTALYRRFGVHSRAQLLAHALQRSGRGEWRDVLTPAHDPDGDDGSVTCPIAESRRTP
jgi:DNA-binding CsgD family transcriptional regulator